MGMGRYRTAGGAQPGWEQRGWKGKQAAWEVMEQPRGNGPVPHCRSTRCFVCVCVYRVAGLQCRRC